VGGEPACATNNLRPLKLDSVIAGDPDPGLPDVYFTNADEFAGNGASRPILMRPLHLRIQHDTHLARTT